MTLKLYQKGKVLAEGCEYTIAYHIERLIDRQLGINPYIWVKVTTNDEVLIMLPESNEDVTCQSDLERLEQILKIDIYCEEEFDLAIKEFLDIDVVEVTKCLQS